MKRTFLRRSPQSNFDFTDVFRKEQRGTWLYSSIIFNTNEEPA